MRNLALHLFVLASLVGTAACEPSYRHRRHDHVYDRGPSYERGPYYERDAYHSDDAWDVVRRDPCRLDEYRRFAAEHRDPERRRRFVERLAREGCRAERVRYDSDDAWDIVRRDPCRYEQYQRFAREHKNPEKRRRFIERLAREGCDRRADDRYDPYP